MTDFPSEVGTRPELTRIGFTGTLWFGAFVVAAAVGVAGLFAADWHPDRLGTGGQVVWWAGTAAVLAGIGCLAWAGCPVISENRMAADRNKSLTVRAGVLLFMIGGTASSLTVLLG